jgi:hypothetical protein
MSLSTGVALRLKRAVRFVGRAVLLVAVLGIAAPVHASWTASGTFTYRDRDYDQTGFTGIELPLPVRLADVEIVDANANGPNSVLASGVTAVDGSFSIFVSDNKTRDVYVRVVSNSDGTANLHIDVRSNSSGQAEYYAVAGPTITGHSPSVNVNFGSIEAQIGQGGEAFNLYDQMLRGTNYILFLTGSRPESSQHLTTRFGLNNGVNGSYYDAPARTIVARDTSGYDDTVVLHEMGHFVIREYSESDALGAPHTFTFCFIDIRLAWEEGWASFWGNSVLRHHGVPRSNIYTRTNGGPGPGNVVRYADLESDSQYVCSGSTSEVNIFNVLWDIVDGPSTPDTTPGVDDAHDLLDMDDTEVWEVMTTQMPGALNTSLEDFWDGWFLAPVMNGFRSELIDITDHLDIEFYEDVREVNDTPATAWPMPTDGSVIHGTLFRDPELDGSGAPDEDYYSFQALANQEYVGETSNLWSDGNTVLQIYSTDGTTLVASNDNQASGDDTSKVTWTAPADGIYFVRIYHATDWGVYGSYNLTLIGASPAPSTPSDTGGGRQTNVPNKPFIGARE